MWNPARLLVDAWTEYKGGARDPRLTYEFQLLALRLLDDIDEVSRHIGPTKTHFRTITNEWRTHVLSITAKRPDTGLYLGGIDYSTDLMYVGDFPSTADIAALELLADLLEAVDLPWQFVASEVETAKAMLVEAAKQIERAQLPDRVKKHTARKIKQALDALTGGQDGPTAVTTRLEEAIGAMFGAAVRLPAGVVQTKLLRAVGVRAMTVSGTLVANVADRQIAPPAPPPQITVRVDVRTDVHPRPQLERGKRDQDQGEAHEQNQ